MSEVALIGKVARAAGVNVQTVRYYERLGLLPRPGRTAAGYRLYTPEATARLRFIKRAQALGFSLGEVKEILRLRYEGRSPCECVRGLLEQKLAQVEREMAALTRFRQELGHTLKRSQKLARLPHSASAICPIIENQPSNHRKRKEREKR